MWRCGLSKIESNKMHSEQHARFDATILANVVKYCIIVHLLSFILKLCR